MDANELIDVLSNNDSFEKKYFVNSFNKIPSTRIFYHQTSVLELKNFFKQLYPNTFEVIYDSHSHYFSNDDKWEVFNGILFLKLKDHLMIHYYNDGIGVMFDQSIDEAELKKLENAILEMVKKSKANKRFFSMVSTSTVDKYDLTDFSLNFSDISIEENYNNDLVELNQSILDFFNKKGDGGLVLFHGLSGTGKTNYIRYLIANSKLKFIYLPNHLINSISDPVFIDFIRDYSESIIILEDCEELLMKRINPNTDRGVANILNLSDGLLGDALKLKLICTFNCELKEIDPAILRKGRLVFRYEFHKLKMEKVEKLFLKLGIKKKVTEELTLAEIYNYEHDNFGNDNERKSIGFSAL